MAYPRLLRGKNELIRCCRNRIQNICTDRNILTSFGLRFGPINRNGTTPVSESETAGHHLRLKSRIAVIFSRPSIYLVRYRRLGLALSLFLSPIAGAFGETPPASPCASCHEQAKTQPATPMAQAMESVAKCRVLIQNPVLTFVDGPYTFRIERRGDESSYTVSKGSEALTLPIRYAVGSSAAIRTNLHTRKQRRVL